MFGEGGATVECHTLTGPGGEEAHTWVTPSDRSFLAGHTVHLRGTHRSGAPFDRSVTFDVR